MVRGGYLGGGWGELFVFICIFVGVMLFNPNRSLGRAWVLKTFVYD